MTFLETRIEAKVLTVYKAENFDEIIKQFNKHWIKR